jgi:hypothetical protein
MIEPEVPQNVAGVSKRAVSKERPTWKQPLKSQLDIRHVILIVSLVCLGLSLVGNHVGGIGQWVIIGIIIGLFLGVLAPVGAVGVRNRRRRPKSRVSPRYRKVIRRANYIIAFWLLGVPLVILGLVVAYNENHMAAYVIQMVVAALFVLGGGGLILTVFVIIPLIEAYRSVEKTAQVSAPTFQAKLWFAWKALRGDPDA